MLRMLLLGLLIPFGVGVLAAMELRTPPRTAVAAVQPVAEPGARISDSHDALAKADRLEVTPVTSETPAQPASVTPASEATATASSEARPTIKRQRPDPKPKKVTTAVFPRPVIPKPALSKSAVLKPKPKTAEIKRTAAPARANAAANTDSCRLSAFGGLRKALNLGGCEL